jgi:hypothetical protein
MRLGAIWRPGCSYKRRRVCRHETCVQRPQGGIQLMLQSPPYQ